MSPNPWRWRDGTNPYLTTPFQLLNLRVDVAGRGPVESTIRKRRQRVQSSPERYRVFGETLDVAKVNAAADAVRDPEERCYAELCTHRPREAAALDLAEIIAALDRIPPTVPPTEVTLDLRRLAHLVPPPSPRPRETLIEW